MVVITLTDCPIALRGDLTKWLLEINTGVFVGRLSARVRENIWLRVKKHIKNGRATMVYSAANEQGLDFKVISREWEPIDFDGIKLILRPSPARIQQLSNVRKPGSSKASRLLTAKRAAGRKAYNGATSGRSYTVIDIETTGLTPGKSEIFEIGAMRVVDGHVTDTFTSLIKTKKPISEKIEKLTGITTEIAKNEGKELKIALSGFLEFISDLPLVAHNINFDISFLNDACRQFGFREIHNELIDTLSMARQTVQKSKSYSLKVLAEHFDFHEEVYHRCLKDCSVTYKLYEKLINLRLNQK